MTSSPPVPVSTCRSAPTAARKNGLARQITEATICLALAVVLFRGFAIEGYMISTGSMAPCLLGYHRQVVCPTCSFAFSRGTRFDDDGSILASGGRESDLVGAPTTEAIICPNCGQTAIDASQVPRNEGDQLLVHKHLYQLRSPRRWEVVVFRHPADPLQAYLKRVVGLPEETVQVVDGDVIADGTLQRKPLEIQRSMRIAVYDHDHVPTDANWHKRWRSGERSAWSGYGPGFVHRRDAEASGESAQIDWLTYHHWIREGGDHLTKVDLSTWPAGVAAARAIDRRLSYDAERRQLSFVGVLPEATFRRLQLQSEDSGWSAAIAALKEQSHSSPVVDQYGYNHPLSGDGPTSVHDLMLEVEVGQLQGEGEWRLRMTDGWQDFDLVFDVAAHQVCLHVDHNDDPIRTAKLPESLFDGKTTIEMSLFDRQVLVAIDGEMPFAPLPYQAGESRRQQTCEPVQVGARDLDLQLRHLRLYRDVHYTAKHATGRADVAQLGPDEFFMLGDNSPVSVDSRAWESPAIPRELLIGKPFFVHLPSRQWSGRADRRYRVCPE